MKSILCLKILKLFCLLLTPISTLSSAIPIIKTFISLFTPSKEHHFLDVRLYVFQTSVHWLVKKSLYFVVYPIYCNFYNSSVLLQLFISSRKINLKFHVFLFLPTLSYLMCIFPYAIAYQLHFLGSLNCHVDMVAPKRHSYFSLCTVWFFLILYFIFIVYFLLFFSPFIPPSTQT